MRALPVVLFGALAVVAGIMAIEAGPAAQSDPERPAPELGTVARTGRHGRVLHRHAASRVGRGQEHPVEGGDPGSWACDAGGVEPVHADGLVFLTSGFQGNDLKAIRLNGARGNLDGTPHVVWSLDRDTPYMASPVIVDGTLYFLKTNSGILSAFDANTGRPHYQNQRLEGVPMSSLRRRLPAVASTSPVAKARPSSSAAGA